jgi:DNA-binding NarL/FixJ family response regulator
VAHSTRAYALFRQAGDVPGAVQCAVWLAIVYKANFANSAAANGWVGRADRLLEPFEVGPLHGWSLVARAYRQADLNAAEALTERAVDLARRGGDVDLELVALAQLGLIRVGRGETAAGFALVDEAMAAALAGEGTTLDTVVYTCCDMLNACELVSDVERAAQWCQVVDAFVETYGCPFLYAECRIYYGGVLAAKGRWSDAERELDVGLRMTEDGCPGLYSKGLARLGALRVRQGRLEEAEQLLSHVGASLDDDAEVAMSIAALALARGDAAAASRTLERRLQALEDHRWHLAAALDLLLDAHLACGEVDAAVETLARLDRTATEASSQRLDALAAGARGRLSLARGDVLAAAQLAAAMRMWSALDLPFEESRARFQLARALRADQRDAAVAHARRALATFESLGATVDADRVAAFLRSLGVVPRTGRKGVGALTDREREVLQLLRSGLSNPQIAERLHVSHKTASHHVSSILTKLNLRNRAEAAAHAVALLGVPGRPPPSPT